VVYLNFWVTDLKRYFGTEAKLLLMDTSEVDGKDAEGDGRGKRLRWCLSAGRL